jgi:hypothetical protein
LTELQRVAGRSGLRYPYDIGVSRSKKQFKEYSPAKQFWIAVLIAVSLGLVGAAERDIQRRPADQVRGSKLLWRLVCLNALGSVSYFRWGRRPAVDVAHT